MAAAEGANQLVSVVTLLGGRSNCGAVIQTIGTRIGIGLFGGWTDCRSVRFGII